MKLSAISALLMPLAFAGVILAGPVTRDESKGLRSGMQENVKRQNQIFDVTVGSASGALAFFPDSITGAQVGDQVRFTLAGGSNSHTITQAAGASEPCVSVPNGVNHLFNPSDPKSLVFLQTVEFASPFFAFSNVIGECEQGMTFTVNAS